MNDRRGQVWEDGYGRLHLIVKEGVPGRLGAHFHTTLRLMTGEIANVTDMPGMPLEQRRYWRRLA